MMEFILSRVWMVVAGLALTAVVIAAFNGMDQNTLDKAAMDRANGFADMIFEIGVSRSPCEIRVNGGDVLIDGSSTIELMNGSLWIDDGITRKAIELPTGVGYIESGMSVERMLIRQDDVLMVTSMQCGNGTVYVQVEKVEATSFTASTNILHSSTVL